MEVDIGAASIGWLLVCVKVAISETMRLGVIWDEELTRYLTGGNLVLLRQWDVDSADAPQKGRFDFMLDQRLSFVNVCLYFWVVVG